MEKKKMNNFKNRTQDEKQESEEEIKDAEEMEYENNHCDFVTRIVDLSEDYMDILGGKEIGKLLLELGRGYLANEEEVLVRVYFLK